MSENGAREIRVPQLGEGLREARIVQLLCAPGAPLRRGDRLYVIETDKTTVELEAPFDGTLLGMAGGRRGRRGNRRDRRSRGGSRNPW